MASSSPYTSCTLRKTVIFCFSLSAVQSTAGHIIRAQGTATLYLTRPLFAFFWRRFAFRYHAKPTDFLCTCASNQWELGTQYMQRATSQGEQQTHLPHHVSDKVHCPPLDIFKEHREVRVVDALQSIEDPLLSFGEVQPIEQMFDVR